MGMGGGTHPGGVIGGYGGFETPAALESPSQSEQAPARPNRPRLSRAAQRRRASLAGLERGRAATGSDSIHVTHSSSTSRRASTRGRSTHDRQTSSGSSKRWSKNMTQITTEDGAGTVSASSPSSGSMKGYMRTSSRRIVVGAIGNDSDSAVPSDRNDITDETAIGDGRTASMPPRQKRSATLRPAGRKLPARPRRGRHSVEERGSGSRGKHHRSDTKRHFMEPDVSIRPDFAATLRIEWQRARRANAIRRFEERASQLKQIAGLMQQIAERTNEDGDQYDREESEDTIDNEKQLLNGASGTEGKARRRSAGGSIRDQFVGLGGFTR